MKIYGTVQYEKPPKYCRNKHYVTFYDQTGEKIEAGIFYRNFNMNRKQLRLFKDIVGGW